MAEILNHSNKLWTAITNVKGDTNVGYTIKSTNPVETEEEFNKIIWVDGHDENDTPPEEITWDKVNAEMDRLQTEYDAQDYARKRQAEYPAIADQLDKIYHDGIDSWKEEMILPVKNKFPKT
jgi:hypothetical protein